jgi:hypothetical protein
MTFYSVESRRIIIRRKLRYVGVGDDDEHNHTSAGGTKF